MQRLLTLVSAAVPASVDKGRHGVNRVQVEGVPGVMGKGAEHGLIHRHFPLKEERTGVTSFFFCEQQLDYSSFMFAIK